MNSKLYPNIDKIFAWHRNHCFHIMAEVQNACRKICNDDDKAKSAPALRGRTFTGCWACRFKKRRCDELKPRCSLCAKHNDKCCYDVRLIWLEENIYKLLNQKSNVMVNVSQLNTNSKKRRKISKKKFKYLTQFRALSPPSSDHDDDDEEDENVEDKCHMKLPAESTSVSKLNDDSFTISIRRLKIYDNAVDSVYGKGSQRNYAQKCVNKTLSAFLDTLEEDDRKEDSCCIDARQGPFSKFSFNCLSKSMNLPSPNNHHNHLDSESSKNKKLYIENLVESKIYNLLWLNIHGNMILSRVGYCAWFLNYIKRTLPYKFATVLQEIIDDANPFNISSWIKTIKTKWSNNPDWQTIAFTILTVVHGYTCPELVRELETWFLTQSILKYSMFPLINFIVRNSTSLTVLYHCNELLNNNNENSQELHEDEITYELYVFVTEKLVIHWKDKILEQLCACQDTTHSCSQLKFWELQLKYNENFYNDVYSTVR